MEQTLSALRAAGEHTRLRVLVALRDTELTVGELVEVLEQSQPRVSRHLGILHDAGLVTRAAEGTSASFRLARRGPHGPLIDTVLAGVDLDDPQFRADARILDQIRDRRADAADAYFDAIASRWDDVRHLHVADATVERALVDRLGRRRPTCLVDIGTGTGRMLEVFAPFVGRAIGIDTSLPMLRAARAHLDRDDLRHCEIRRGDAYAIDLPEASADLVVLHHVLHFLERPSAALAEAARLLTPDGLLLVVDFAPHDVETLRTEFAHRHFGFADDELRHLAAGTSLQFAPPHHFDPSTDSPLGVTIWSATPAPSPVLAGTRP